jgi:hypothetical protein
MALNLKKTMADWLVCQCGNEPHKDGFYACAIDGRPVDPVIGSEWKGNIYVCSRCYAIYDIDLLEQIGDASLEAQDLLNEENIDFKTPNIF